MTKPFTGEYIWIIGASSGIGQALAIELAEQGAILAVSARRADNLNAVLGTLPGDEHLAVPLDAGDPDSMRHAKQKS